jgi:CxxC-x17-CxxC domain-containing protein
MAYFNKGNQSGNNRNFGKPRFNRERTEMFSATCANCGNQCEVPFRPTGSKPVLCRDCFKNNRGSDTRSSFDRPRINNDENRERHNQSSNYNAQFEALNAKMDKILNLLTPQPVVVPLESEISEEAIDEIVEEIQEEKKEAKAKKQSKAKTSVAKSTSKPKKASSKKK